MAEEQSKTKMIAMEPLSPTMNELIKYFEGQPQVEVLRAANPDEAYQLIVQSIPALFFLCITDNNGFAPVITLLKKCERALKTSMLRATVLAAPKNQKLSEMITSLGVTEYIQEPITLKKLQFKSSLQVRGIETFKRQLEAKKAGNQNQQIKKLEARATPEKAAPTLKFKRLPKLNIPEDEFLARDGFGKKKGKVQHVELEGPDPSAGKWQKDPKSTDKKPKWKWKPNKDGDKEDPDKPTGWAFEGDEPTYDVTKKKWDFASEKPDLSYYKDGIKMAKKLGVDEQGELEIAEDSPEAEEKVKKAQEMVKHDLSEEEKAPQNLALKVKPKSDREEDDLKLKTLEKKEEEKPDFRNKYKLGEKEEHGDEGGFRTQMSKPGEKGNKESKEPQFLKKDEKNAELKVHALGKGNGLPESSMRDQKNKTGAKEEEDLYVKKDKFGDGNDGENEDSSNKKRELKSGAPTFDKNKFLDKTKSVDEQEQGPSFRNKVNGKNDDKDEQGLTRDLKSKPQEKETPNWKKSLAEDGDKENAGSQWNAQKNKPKTAETENGNDPARVKKEEAELKELRQKTHSKAEEIKTELRQKLKNVLEEPEDKDLDEKKIRELEEKTGLRDLKNRPKEKVNKLRKVTKAREIQEEIKDFERKQLRQDKDGLLDLDLKIRDYFGKSMKDWGMDQKKEEEKKSEDLKEAEREKKKKIIGELTDEKLVSREEKKDEVKVFLIPVAEIKPQSAKWAETANGYLFVDEQLLSKGFKKIEEVLPIWEYKEKELPLLVEKGTQWKFLHRKPVFATTPDQLSGAARTYLLDFRDNLKADKKRDEESATSEDKEKKRDQDKDQAEGLRDAFKEKDPRVEVVEEKKKSTAKLEEELSSKSQSLKEFFERRKEKNNNVLEETVEKKKHLEEIKKSKYDKDELADELDIDSKTSKRAKLLQKYGGEDEPEKSREKASKYDTEEEAKSSSLNTLDDKSKQKDIEAADASGIDLETESRNGAKKKNAGSEQDQKSRTPQDGSQYLSLFLTLSDCLNPNKGIQRAHKKVLKSLEASFENVQFCLLSPSQENEKHKVVYTLHAEKQNTDVSLSDGNFFPISIQSGSETKVLGYLFASTPGHLPMNEQELAAIDRVIKLLWAMYSIENQLALQKGGVAA